ncbi:MAG: acireductone synthase [Methylococcus sp.]
MTRAILTDIEGTTSSLSFVKDVLFPYARERMEAFVTGHAGEPAVARELEDVNRLAGRQLTPVEAARQLVEWIDQDRKVTPLKALQGMIWEAGYREGAFFGHVYSDAVRKLREWHEAGLALYIFSSGSVHAQRLLFGHTEGGDLTPLFSGYYDTRIGAKQEADAYRAIAADIGLPAESILFLSDTLGELDAARSAGFKTTWLVRGDDPATSGSHPLARDFDEISL